MRPLCAAWFLTLAYDVTFAQGLGFIRSHQMWVRDKREGVTRADVITVADDFGVQAAARGIGG